MLQIVLLDRLQAADRNRFIQIPYHIYQNDPNWVAPLKMTEHIKLSNKEPFYEHAEAQMFVAVRDGRDVGRILAVDNPHHQKMHGEAVGFFGFFECEQDPEAATALLQAAEAWFKQRGLAISRGPVNLSTNHTVGLLVAGDLGMPMVDMTYNPPYYADMITSCGYAKAMDVVAHIMDVKNPDNYSRLEKLAERVRRKENVTTRPLNMKQFKAEMKVVKELYNSAWEKNWGFVPLTDKEFDFVAEDLKMAADPQLVRMVFVDDQPVGFIGVVLNLNEIFIKLKGNLFPFGIFKLLLDKPKIKSVRLLLMGVKKEYRQRGLETVMYYDALKHAMARGLVHCENSWLLETNKMVIRASEFMGGKEYRRYRIYDKPLTANTKK